MDEQIRIVINNSSKIMRASKRIIPKKNTFYQEVEECEDDVDAEQDDDSPDFSDVDGVINAAGDTKIYMFGEKTTGFRATGPLQDYTKLREQHLQNKTLFLDYNFAPKSIVLKNLDGPVVWKRPFEIIDDPQFIIDGASRFDVDQGLLGDCWFLAAMANLTMNPELFTFVVPPDQSLTENYAGIFHFRFWQFGRWVDVVIDDRLPTVNNQLVYLRSSDPREFWPSLLEKAYAKFYGSYKNIEGGQIAEALEDLCGGLSESYPANHPHLYEIMYMSFERSSFMGCSIMSTEMEGRREDGLVTSHAYSITYVTAVNAGDYDVRLLRLRNPWGNRVEWNGRWSDDSEQWNLVRPEQRRRLLSKKADGEFWMEIDDFQRCFSNVDICHPNPSSLFYSSGDNKNWVVNMFEGSWVPHITAGGGFKCLDTFESNPQYHLTIKQSQAALKFPVIVGLMQKNRRIKGEDELPLELNIFRVKTAAGNVLNKEFFQSTNPVIHKMDYGERQLTARVVLPAGKYCVIPSTVQPNIFESYLLRIYSEANTHSAENDEDIGYSSDAILSQSDTKIVDNHILFKTVAGNASDVNWYKVQRALNKIFGTRRTFCFVKPRISFSKNTCKNIVALRDSNYSGKLDDQEFSQLIQDVASLREIFKKYDEGNSGKLSGFKLKSLLTECGYNVDKKILITIMLRYGYNGAITFENFVICAFKLRTMIDEFHRRKTIDAGDQINVNKRDWVQTILYS